MDSNIKSCSEKLAELVSSWYVTSPKDICGEDMSLPEYLHLTNEEFIEWGVAIKSDEDIYLLLQRRKFCQLSVGNG